MEKIVEERLKLVEKVLSNAIDRIDSLIEELSKLENRIIDLEPLPSWGNET